MAKVLWSFWFVLEGVLAPAASGRAASPEPPPQLKILAGQEGEWNVTFQVLDAEQHWETAHCSARIRMVLDGAAQAVDFEGRLNGRKYLGNGLTCFDRETGNWQSTWADNQGGRITLYEGTWQGNDLVLQGIERAQGQKLYSRITSAHIGPKHFEWTMDISTDGRDFRTIARATYDKR
jgi:Protein of unknown function (DUF1579)